MKLGVFHLSCKHLEVSTNVGDDWPHYRTFCLQRVHITEQDIEFDILLGDVHSLKAKRSVVRPIIADIRRHFQVFAAEVEDAQLHRRTVIGISLVSSDRSHVEETLTKIEEFVARRPEIDLLSSKM